MKPLKFEVNEYITIKLEKENVNIYVGGELFNQCKYILINKTIDELIDLDSINSIDELAENLDHSLERIEPELIDIPIETQFWVHCSNLQAWYENKYDTRLLHSNLSFPLLKILTESGDKLAKKVFKEEIAKRYKDGNWSTKNYLIKEKYLSYLSYEELLYGILDTEEALILESISKYTSVIYEVVTDFDSVRHKLRYENLFFSIKNGHIWELEIELTKDHPILPQEIGKLNRLASLNIYMTDLDEKIPQFSTELRSLYFLRILCEGRVIIPDLFDKFPNISVLRITGSGLTSFEKIPETIGALNNLTELFMTWVNIEELPHSIKNLKNLEWMTIKNAGLKRYPVLALKLENLIEIDLTGNFELDPTGDLELQIRLKEYENIDINELFPNTKLELKKPDKL